MIRMAILNERRSLLPSVNDTDARVTPEQFDAMYDGLEDAHVELLNGRLYLKVSQNLLHIESVGLVFGALFQATRGTGLIAGSQGTVSLGDDRFEPDAFLFRLNAPRANRHVKGDEVQLAVEVSVSTLAYDRGEKLEAYARHGVPEVWIVNPSRRLIEVYREPQGEKFGDEFLFLPGESLDCLALPGATFAVDELLPPAAETQTS